MIEKILAEAVSYETPVIRANNLFDEIEMDAFYNLKK